MSVKIDKLALKSPKMLFFSSEWNLLLGEERVRYPVILFALNSYFSFFANQRGGFALCARRFILFALGATLNVWVSAMDHASDFRSPARGGKGELRWQFLLSPVALISPNPDRFFQKN
jgi:hypothetical protein